MPNNCAVLGCSSSYVKNENITFHKFPKNKELKGQWIGLCKRPGLSNIKNARVCGLHFTLSAYKRNLMYELLGQPVPPNRKSLNEDAVPTLNLPSAKDSVCHVNTVDIRRKSRKGQRPQAGSTQTVSKEETKKPKAAERKGTRKPAKWGLNDFKEWLEANDHPKQFESVSKEELDQLLARLYAEVRNKKSEKFTKTAYIHMRDAIQKHLESSPWNIDYVIKTDPAFSHSNTILDKLEPLDCPLNSCEVEQLVKTGTIGMHNPTALQNLVWISIALHVGELNITQWARMTKNSFTRSTDERGMDYIGWPGGCTKSKSDDSSAYFSRKEHLKIYALSQELLCPVKAFDKYVSLLNPAIDELWQKPNSSYKKTNQWYLKHAAGKHTIVDMMKNMCLQAKLSKQHSNTCLHVTSRTILMEADIQESYMQTSGHWRKTIPCRRKLLRETEGLNWPEENQTHCYEDLVTVDNIPSSDLVIKCEDIKIEDEDPLAFPGIEDIPGDYDDLVPQKRLRLGSDEDLEVDLNEEQIDPFADVVGDNPSVEQMTDNSFEDREAETCSPSLVDEDEAPETCSSSLVDEDEPPETCSSSLVDEDEPPETENSTAPQDTHLVIESRKKDIYDSFAGQIAKTLRDLNDLDTFRRVQIEINDILLTALSGKSKNLKCLKKQPLHVFSNTMPVRKTSHGTQTTVSQVNDGNSTPVLCIINPKHVTLNQKPNQTHPKSVVQNPDPAPSKSITQNSNSDTAIGNANPDTLESMVQNPNPVTAGPVIQNPNSVTSGAVLQNENPAPSGPILQNQNSISQKPFNLGQLVNNPMNLWQLLKNPQMPKQVMLRPINLRQMSQIVGSMKQAVPQQATSATASSATKQATSALTLTLVSASDSNT